MRPITREEIETFRADGIVCLRGLFAPAWIERLRRAAEAGLATPGELSAELAAARKDRGRFFHDTFVWRHNVDCRAFVFESPAARIAAALMGSRRVNIFFDQWLIKEPGTPTRTPWHQDLPYWPINGWQVATLWLALDEVGADSGAVEYLRGSHRWGRRYRPVAFSGQPQYTEPLPPMPNIEARREILDILRFDLAPGDCTVHHALLLHGAPGNQRLDRRRRAYVTRWTGDDVIFNPRDGI
ncbi:MAG: phytanoyl-CoA dioxygenase family protein, partial [Kiloniellaceae bacterium]